MNNKNEIQVLINEYSHLFWYTPPNEKENIDEDQLVETILNYGDEKAIKRMIEIMGMNRVADIFKKHITTSNRRKNNYHELVANYFQLYFSRHAKEYTIR